MPEPSNFIGRALRDYLVAARAGDKMLCLKLGRLIFDWIIENVRKEFWGFTRDERDDLVEETCVRLLKLVGLARSADEWVATDGKGAPLIDAAMFVRALARRLALDAYRNKLQRAQLLKKYAVETSLLEQQLCSEKGTEFGGQTGQLTVDVAFERQLIDLDEYLVWLLHDAHDLKFEYVALHLGVSLSTVKRRWAAVVKAGRQIHGVKPPEAVDAEAAGTPVVVHGNVAEGSES
jgi:DNA-directed RNA polymerase specialized sigma24 family protein